MNSASQKFSGLFCRFESVVSHITKKDEHQLVLFYCSDIDKVYLEVIFAVK
jgi:hypothetical protein